MKNLNFDVRLRADRHGIQLQATRNGYQYSGLTVDTLEELQEIVNVAQGFIDSRGEGPVLPADAESLVYSRTYPLSELEERLAALQVASAQLKA
jgi:hypothetical protein